LFKFGSRKKRFGSVVKLAKETDHEKLDRVNREISLNWQKNILYLSVTRIKWNQADWNLDLATKFTVKEASSQTISEIKNRREFNMATYITKLFQTEQIENPRLVGTKHKSL